MSGEGRKAKKAEYDRQRRARLKDEIVCGLHVPENLRPLSPTENVRKKNKMPTEIQDAN